MLSENFLRKSIDWKRIFTPPWNYENLARLSRAKLCLSSFWSAISLFRQMYWKSIFLHMKYDENSKWTSLILLIVILLSNVCSCLYKKIATSCPELFKPTTLLLTNRRFTCPQTVTHPSSNRARFINFVDRTQRANHYTTPQPKCNL